MLRRNLQNAHLKLRRFKQQLHIKTADSLIVSFPKCGRTWLRLMIGRSIQLYYNLPEDKEILELGKDLSKYHKDIPKIIVFHDGNPHLKRTSELETSKKKYRNKKVIFMIRDPRDVMISNYFQQTKRDNTFEGSLKDFIENDVGSIDSLLEYYSIWDKNKFYMKQFMVVKYENLHRNTEEELKRVLDFLDLDFIPLDIVKQSVEYASFKNMRKMENNRKFNSDKLQPGKDSDPRSLKTRKGIIGDYKNQLNDEELALINKKIKNKLSNLELYKDYL